MRGKLDENFSQIMTHVCIKFTEQAPYTIVKRWLNRNTDDPKIYFQDIEKEWIFDDFSHFLKIFKPFGLPDADDQSSPYN